MLDPQDLEPTKLVHARGSRPRLGTVDGLLVASDDATSLAMARFRYVEPGASLVQSWPGNLGVTMVMLTGTLVLVTEDSGLLVQRDDVVALGTQRGYAVGNHLSSDGGSSFIEFWTRRNEVPRREAALHLTVDRHHRIRTFVDLVPSSAAGPRVVSVILYPGDVVTYELAVRRAYVVSTVGTVTINGLEVAPQSAAMLCGPGRTTIRTVDSTEVLVAALPSGPRASRMAARFDADQRGARPHFFLGEHAPLAI